VYALMSQVYNQDDRDVYISLSNTLDVGSVSLEDAREYPGVANVAAVGGRLLVSDGQAPTITSYDIGDDLSWTEGATVSFSEYPLSDGANLYYHFFVNDETAYLPFDTVKRVVWDPTAMEIRGVMDDSSMLLEQEGMLLEAGGNRNSVRYAGPVQQPFFYHNDDWTRFGDHSFVAIYDTETNRESQVLDVPCGGLSFSTVAEDGTAYFAPWTFPGIGALFGDGPAPCVARVNPDLSLDEAWTTDLTAQTGGRYVNNFRYIGNGKAIANVLHQEMIDGDLTAGYDADIEAQIHLEGPHWRLWSFDLEQGTAAPFEGIDIAIGEIAQFAVLDGRTFVFIPFDEYSRTMIYELGDSLQAIPRLEVQGDVFKWIRVR
jgi:hypothetical protein